MEQPPHHDPNETPATAPSSPSSGGSGSDSSRRMYERSTDTPPERIGPYRILREIGRGGMGLVYLAVRDEDKFHRRVAIKLIRKGMDTEDILKRFDQERQVLAAMNHPNIARLIDGGQTDDGRPYFVVEYVEGLPIDKHCDAHRLKISERLNLFRTVCAAVHYAHQNLIVHRDLKPSNILVTSSGDVKLLDFGIAKLLNPELVAFTQTPTAPELRLMTPEYASPEQVRGDPLTTASDVYSLGVLLYELLTGHRPYRIKTRILQEVVRVICEVEPERPSAAVTRVEEVPDPTSAPASGAPAATRTLGPVEVSRTREGRPDRLRRRLSGDVDNIVLKAMRKEPQRRYASALALSEDLQRHLDGLPVTARPDSPIYRARKFVIRNRASVAAAAAILLALSLGLAGMTWQRNRALEQAQRADRATQGMAAMSGMLLKVFNEMDSFRSSVSRREDFVKDVRTALSNVAQDAPDSPVVARTLAAAHNVVGDVQGGIRGPSAGKPEDAIASYSEAVRILRGLEGRSPEAQVRSDLAATFLALADAQNTAGQSDKALDSYTQSADKAREAIAAGRRDAFSKRVLAAALLKIGDLRRVKGEYDAARDAYRESFNLRRELTGAEPSDPAEARDIALALGRFAQLLADTGDLDGAVEQMRESLNIRRANLEKEAAANAPPRTDSLRAPRDVWVALYTLGHFSALRGDLEEAATHLREAVQIAEQLRAAMPDNIRGPRDLALTRTALASLHAQSDAHDLALAEFRRAAEAANDAAQRAPQDRTCAEALRDARLGAAQTLIALGRPRDALNELVVASETSSAWLEKDPERNSIVLADANIRLTRALAEWSDGAPPDALRDAALHAASLATALPEDASRAQLRAESQLAYAWALFAAGADAEVAEDLRSLSLSTKMLAENPGASAAIRAANADTLAALAFITRDPAAALALARQARDAAPKPSPKVLWALSRALRASGDPTAADAARADAFALLAKAPAGSPDARLRAAIELDRATP